MDQPDVYNLLAALDITAVNCWAIAREALDRIENLYAVEDDIRGAPPNKRRNERKTRAGPNL